MARLDPYRIEVLVSTVEGCWVLMYYLDITKTAVSTRISYKTWKKARKLTPIKAIYL